MSRRGGRRLLAAGAVVVVVAAVLLVIGAFGGTPSGPADGSRTSAQTDAGTVAASRTQDGAAGIAKLQQRLKDVPGDWTAWADLAASYVQQGRITADPTYYPKADGALAQSFRIQPNDNYLALTVQATVAAARHDFSDALRLADSSLAINAYDASTYGVKGDALNELGRYDEAFAAFTKMDETRPGVASFSRLSYSYELRGNIPKARKDLQLALDTSTTSPSDAAFAAYYLGELAWNYDNDLPAAERYYRQGIRLDPNYVPPLAGLAKVEAAQARTDAAVRDYTAVVNRLPLPQYVIEFGDYLTSIGRTSAAAQQYELVLTEEKLFQSQGVNVDLELALFQADHGDTAGALRTASAEYGRRRSIHVEDAYAWALHVNGRDVEALQHANASLRLGTRSALFHFHRGMIEKALGRDSEASADLKQALAINAHFSSVQAPQAHRALEQLGAG